MKLQSEQKALIVEGTKLLGVVGVCIALFVAAGAWKASMETSKTQEQGKAGQQTAEINTLRDKIKNSGASKELYASVVETRRNESFTIDNDKVRDVLQDLVKRHRLSVNDKLEYSAEKDFTSPSLTSLTTPITVRQEAKLKFAAISDLHAYSFIQALARELPGVVKYTHFKLTRKYPMDTELITQLATGRAVYAVDVELTFDWFSIRNESQDAAANNAQTGEQP